MACEACETEIEHLCLLAPLCPQEAAVGDVDASTTGHLGHVKEHDPGHFVYEEHPDDRDVQQKKEEDHRDKRGTERGFLDIGKRLDGVEAKRSTFLHYGGLLSVFRKGCHAV